MSVYAEFTIAADEFTLGQVLSRDSNTHVEMERIVPSSGQVMPYVWVHGGDLDEFKGAIRASDELKELTRLDTLDGSALYRIEWEEREEGLITGMANAEATILSASGGGE
jgi:hypothetical protein